MLWTLTPHLYFTSPLASGSFAGIKAVSPGESSADFLSALRITVKILDHLSRLPIHSRNVAAIRAGVFPSRFFEFPDTLMAH